MRFLFTPPTGLEPVTPWLTVRCSTDWAMEEYCPPQLSRLPAWAMEEYSVQDYIGILAAACVSEPFCSENEREVRTLRLTSVVSCWRIPIFPGRRQPSIVGTTELNFCVRNGNRWTLCVNLTNYPSMLYTDYCIIQASLRQVLTLLLPICYIWMHLQGFEPGTHWLRVSCSTNWAKGAWVCTFRCPTSSSEECLSDVHWKPNKSL